MAKEIKNLGASIRARLLTLSKSSGQPFDLLLTRFVLERLLYRLSRSPHRDKFVLKGAMLLTTWIDNPQRGTRDLDFLGFGASEGEAVLELFREILTDEADDDGVSFAIAELRVDRIRDELEYGGVRLRTRATVGGAVIPVVVDIGFGDATEPGLEELDYPVLLDFPAPRIRAYARETVIAEKLQAMVALGDANSRMKDFYDIWSLSTSATFDGDRLARAIAATFTRRKTPIPDGLPRALTPEFARDPLKRDQWNAFAADVMATPPKLEDVCRDIAVFLVPHLVRARDLT
jgi:predicted nucleotidyltransferase component of viral defense system